MKYATSTALCQLCENRSPTMFVRAFVVNILVTIPYQLNVSFLYIMLTFHLNVKYIVHCTTRRMHASLSCTLYYPLNACVPEKYIVLIKGVCINSCKRNSSYEVTSSWFVHWNRAYKFPNPGITGSNTTRDIYSSELSLNYFNYAGRLVITWPRNHLVLCGVTLAGPRTDVSINYKTLTNGRIRYNT